MKEMDGQSHLDELARLKFRLLQIVLEICNYKKCFGVVYYSYLVVLDRFQKISRNALALLLFGPMFTFHRIPRILVLFV